MPRVKPIKHFPRLQVDVETRKCTGSQIRCVPCGYTGPADVVRMTSRRNGKRSLERCPECKSLNIVSCEESLMSEENKPWEVNEWENCYPSNWKGVIVPEAMSHPAKFSSRLIRRIYEHLFEQGWVVRGVKVLDPFGGVALGALHAMQMGLHWVGNELEPKFVELGAGYDCPGFSKHDWVRFYGRAKRVNFSHDHHWCPECLERMDSHVKEVSHDLFSSNGHGLIPSAPAHRFQGNIDLWNATYGGQPHWGTAVLLQGDSRKLAASLQRLGFSGSVSSPPFASVEGAHSARKYADPEKVAKEMAEKYRNGTFKGHAASEEAILKSLLDANGQTYGDSSGQMANMKTSEQGFQASLSSPPFRHSEGGTPEPKPGGVIDERLYARHAAGNSAADGYGVTEGQLANMKEKTGFEGAVSSPPYAQGAQHTGGADSNPEKMNGGEINRYGVGDGYGTTEGQLGADSGDDFWLAARQIVEQVFILLEPGGHACWVVKDFVRNKERVAFSDQWRQLCEAVGFVTVHEHHAMLVHHKGVSLTLDGEKVEHKTESKSFFRRIAERKGSPRVDWEVVWCMEKPKGAYNTPGGNNGQ